MARFAYADPPYPGMAHRYPEKTEVDHADLIARLDVEFDGWALSTHVPGLRVVIPLLPPRARVCAWVKPWAFWKPNVMLGYAWEPVIVAPIRNAAYGMRDWVPASATRERAVVGAKPDEFSYWLFGALGARDGDEFVDLYPGSGAVGRAWDVWRRQVPLTVPDFPSATLARNLELGFE